MDGLAAESLNADSRGIVIKDETVVDYCTFFDYLAQRGKFLAGSIARHSHLNVRAAIGDVNLSGKFAYAAEFLIVLFDADG